MGVRIVGVSNDATAPNAKFAGECGFSYPLLCDESLAISVAYGAADSKDDGKAKRIAVHIGANGQVVSYHPNVVAREFPISYLAKLRAKSQKPPAPKAPPYGLIAVAVVAVAVAIALYVRSGQVVVNELRPPDLDVTGAASAEA